MTTQVVIAGVGMSKFRKPSEAASYTKMVHAAINEALTDAGLDYGDIQQAFCSYIYGDSCSGQRALYDVGMTGIPVVNVNNNCSSGSTGLFLARQAVQSGEIDCALVVGFEQMSAGALASHFNDRDDPMEPLLSRLSALQPDAPLAPMAIRLFGGAGAEYLQQTGASPELFAQVAVKSRRHAEHNERAVFRTPLTVDEVMAAPQQFPPYLTRLMACPPTSGAAAAIVCSEDFARRKGLQSKVKIVAQSMATDTVESFESAQDLVGASMSRAAATSAYEKAGLGPESIQVVELHDCFTPNEVLSYEALGLCGRGEAEKFVRDGDNTYGGRFVVNPSGGLMSKGHPIGATGVAQCAELVWQLRGQAGVRQVEGARTALQHNIGLGGAVVVTIYSA
ncbi:lipid-transfer protein [Spongiibacter nanhainus]|uniref:propanoyl-CoA C-acyltransferase n=1 Tax=Spongiibacter nanhainus TaxID=2794344 RepID=A0A7T4R013_9GAMM|nr:lipid-transfer protein [Spongiibacter nanhainus]QQD17935.1 lipid-transfer protein [Spongiibacter nanhainus]